MSAADRVLVIITGTLLAACLALVVLGLSLGVLGEY